MTNNNKTKKTKYIKFKATPTEQAEIKRRAVARKMSVSKYIRSCINEQIVVQLPVETENNNLVELSKQLSAVGNNLNQIARALNSNGAVNVVEINDAIDTVSNLQTELKTAIKQTAQLYKKSIKGGVINGLDSHHQYRSR